MEHHNICWWIMLFCGMFGYGGGWYLRGKIEKFHREDLKERLVGRFEVMEKESK